MEVEVRREMIHSAHPSKVLACFFVHVLFAPVEHASRSCTSLRQYDSLDTEQGRPCLAQLSIYTQCRLYPNGTLVRVALMAASTLQAAYLLLLDGLVALKDGDGRPIGEHFRKPVVGVGNCTRVRLFTELSAL